MIKILSIEENMRGELCEIMKHQTFVVASMKEDDKTAS